MIALPKSKVQAVAIFRLMSNGAFDVAAHAEEAWRLFRGMLQAGRDGGRTPVRISARSGQATKKSEQPTNTNETQQSE